MLDKQHNKDRIKQLKRTPRHACIASKVGPNTENPKPPALPRNVTLLCVFQGISTRGRSQHKADHSTHSISFTTISIETASFKGSEWPITAQG